MSQQSNRIYIKLLVYNYDASSRHQSTRHTCKSLKQAQHLAERLQKLIGTSGSAQNHTVRWLDRNHGIYGFVDRIDGIYEEITRRIQ